MGVWAVSVKDEVLLQVTFSIALVPGQEVGIGSLDIVPKVSE